MANFRDYTEIKKYLRAKDIRDQWQIQNVVQALNAQYTTVASNTYLTNLTNLYPVGTGGGAGGAGTIHIGPQPVTYMDHWREQWGEGERAWFEYHCDESPDSDHAEWWYRSHQEVTILEEAASDGWDISSYEERQEAGTPKVYTVLWEDGFSGDVFEDELLLTPAGFDRPDPPKYYGELWDDVIASWEAGMAVITGSLSYLLDLETADTSSCLVRLSGSGGILEAYLARAS